VAQQVLLLAAQFDPAAGREAADVAESDPVAGGAQPGGEYAAVVARPFEGGLRAGAAAAVDLDPVEMVLGTAIAGVGAHHAGVVDTVAGVDARGQLREVEPAQCVQRRRAGAVGRLFQLRNAVLEPLDPLLQVRAFGLVASIGQALPGLLDPQFERALDFVQFQRPHLPHDLATAAGVRAAQGSLAQPRVLDRGNVTFPGIKIDPEAPVAAFAPLQPGAQGIARHVFARGKRLEVRLPDVIAAFRFAQDAIDVVAAGAHVERPRSTAAIRRERPVETGVLDRSAVGA